MRRILLVDMDNCIADQRAGFYAVLAKEYPHLPLPPLEGQRDFDIELSFPEDMRELITSLRLKEGFFASLPAVPGAKEGLTKLSEKHEVRIVTAPTWEWKFCIPEKYAWIEKYVGREWCGRMITTRDKTLVRGDILIDDAPSVIGTLEPEWEHVLFDMPYNRDVDKRRVTWETMDGFVDAL